MIKRTVLLVASLLLVSTVATAGSNWQTFTFSAEPANLPKVVAAFEKLMGSAGPGDKGTVSLMANIAGGGNSHTFISSFDTRAAREAWTQSLVASPAWGEFTMATSGLIDRGETSRMNLLKSWGKESDKDVFWEIYAFAVTDSDAFSKALDDLLDSDTGEDFPGQVYLSAVAASGISQATHLISAGFESEAEAETWNTTMTASKDWTSYQEASGQVSDYAGAYMIRTMQTWGGDDD
jgi:hypothetical protein